MQYYSVTLKQTGQKHKQKQKQNIRDGDSAVKCLGITGESPESVFGR